MALNYGYTIRIQSNGTSNPSTTPTNQWQRKLPGQEGFIDIDGETGTTYTTSPSDQGAEIRLVQKFNGASAPSNVLQVTDKKPSFYPDDWGDGNQLPVSNNDEFNQASVELTIEDHPNWLTIQGVTWSGVLTLWGTKTGAVWEKIGVTNWSHHHSARGKHHWDPATQRCYIHGYSSGRGNSANNWKTGYGTSDSALLNWTRLFYRPDVNNHYTANTIDHVKSPHNWFMPAQAAWIYSKDYANTDELYSERFGPNPGTSGKKTGQIYSDQGGAVLYKNNTWVLGTRETFYTCTTTNMNSWSEYNIRSLIGYPEYRARIGGRKFGPHPQFAGVVAYDRFIFKVVDWKSLGGSGDSPYGRDTLVWSTDGRSWNKYVPVLPELPGYTLWNTIELKYFEPLDALVMFGQAGPSNTAPPYYGVSNRDDPTHLRFWISYDKGQTWFMWGTAPPFYNNATRGDVIRWWYHQPTGKIFVLWKDNYQKYCKTYLVDVGDYG